MPLLLLFSFGSLVTSFGFPFGQGVALHRAEDPFLQIGIFCAELKQQLLDLFPLGFLIDGAAVGQYWQIGLLGEVVHSPLVKIQHRADLDHAASVQIGHRLEAADATFKQ